MNKTISTGELILTIREEIDELELSELTPATEFRQIDGWSSLYSLVLMAMSSTEFGVELSGEQVQRIKTVQDLCDTINDMRN